MVVQKQKSCLILLISFLILNLTISQINNEITSIDYSKDLIKSDFKLIFKSDDDQKNFKRLREYLRDKESLLQFLQRDIDNYEDETYLIKKLTKNITELETLISGKGANVELEIDRELLPAQIVALSRRFYDTAYSIISPTVKKKVSEINKIIEEQKSTIGEIKNNAERYKVLSANIKNVKEDIDKCTRQIDSALAPEYQQQDFRQTISIYFTILIALLLSMFFYIVYKRSDNDLSKDLLSGNGLQFITLFVLIIAVILFGILNILQSSELAAILSGISGYILGKGTQKDLSTILSNSGAPPPPLPSPPAGTTPPAQGATLPIEGATPPAQGAITFIAGATPPEQRATPPIENATPPIQGTTPFVAGANPPAQGTTSQIEGATPPAQGATPPIEGDTPLAQGTTPPEEGTNPPVEETTPPSEGTSHRA